jgi:hypothetical protein
MSSRPHRRRKPQTPTEVVDRIRQLRGQYRRWGKDKLVVLLRREGISVSTSTVGRVIKRLKQRGILKEPVNDAMVKLARKWNKGLFKANKLLCYQLFGLFRRDVSIEDKSYTDRWRLRVEEGF